MQKSIRDLPLFCVKKISGMTPVVLGQRRIISAGSPATPMVKKPIQNPCYRVASGSIRRAGTDTVRTAAPIKLFAGNRFFPNACLPYPEEGFQPPMALALEEFLRAVEIARPKIGSPSAKSVYPLPLARIYLLSSSMRRSGASARFRSGSGKVISGAMFLSAACAFSSVFIFMNRHSAQAHDRSARR